MNTLIHKVLKFFTSLQIASKIVLARTFGEYQHTVWDRFTYHVYLYRGEKYVIPVSVIEPEPF